MMSPSPAPAPGGDLASMGIPPEVLQMIEQVLGRPPQSIEEVEQVLQMLMQQQGGGGGMAPQNAATMQALGGGM